MAIVLPAFRQALQSGQPIEQTGVRLEIPIGRKTVSGTLLRSRLPGSNVPVYLVHQPQYYDRPELYRENGHDYKDNCERFVFFCRAVLETITQLDLGTELVHCHDWTAGLVPAYLKTELAGIPPYDAIRSVLTIHNIAYQGNFWHWDMELTGIDWKYFNWRQMEFYGNLSFLKSGLAFADTLTTVSPRYAQEIQQQPLGCGLEGILQHRHADLFGIINGVDYNEWNPETDSHLDGHNYGVKNFAEGKAACKAALQREFGLPQVADRPLVAMIGRLADQKGFDLVAKLIPQWAPAANAQWVILGTGEPHYHQLLRRAGPKISGQGCGAAGILERAGPSDRSRGRHFPDAEPLRAVRAESALQPEVRHRAGGALRRAGWPTRSRISTTARLSAGTANGFSFDSYTTAALADALDRACRAYADRAVWEQLIRTGMRQDWSWNHSAREYSRLYELTLSRATHAVGG